MGEFIFKDIKMKQKLERIISRLYVDGVYKGNSARTITIYGEEHKLDAIAKEIGS